MEEPIEFVDPSGHRVSAVLATPDRAGTHIAVLCHGFLSRKDSTTNKALTHSLTRRGIATLRFDFFGHGESEGPFHALRTAVGLDQALAAVELVKARGYRRIALVGSSFGGLVSILAAAELADRQRRSVHQTHDLACLALKCPVVDFGEELRLELRETGMEQWRQTDSIPDLHGGPSRIQLDFAFYEDCLKRIAYEPARLITIPTLIVQGDCDEYVPLHQSRLLLDALAGPKRLEMIAGADHQFTNASDFQRMLGLVSDWVEQYLTA
ncbi:MAG TPA: alpha/beta fold hydrolase [Nitrospiraceae bacterium]|nr:alpha/beta fold hydrolase [Nitrospiraceae bacterium]